MNKIAFVTDSCSGLTPTQVQVTEATVVPLSVIIDGASYQDGVDLSAKEFYERMIHKSALPTTSQPSVGQFVAAFEELQKTHDTILCLLLSSKVSGTFHTAEAAAKSVGGDIVVVDSKIASFGVAGPFIDGVELYRSGGTKDEVLKLWDEELASMEARFVVDSLDFLHRGGRIGGAAAAFGSLLQIKPILTVRDGRIELYEKVRTYRRALERILGEFHDYCAAHSNVRLGIVHSLREAEAQDLASKIAEQYRSVEVSVSDLSPVVGTHTGPGVIALIYYRKFQP